jgi:hypothetical protein
MIHHHPPRLPLFPVATLIGSTWVSGQTIRKKNKAAPVAKR